MFHPLLTYSKFSFSGKYLQKKQKKNIIFFIFTIFDILENITIFSNPGSYACVVGAHQSHRLKVGVDISLHPSTHHGNVPPIRRQHIGTIKYNQHQEQKSLFATRQHRFDVDHHDAVPRRSLTKTLQGEPSNESSWDCFTSSSTLTDRRHRFRAPPLEHRQFSVICS